MRVPNWLIVIAAVVCALPFGAGVGVMGAYVITAGVVGQLPILTVPLGLVFAIAFALWPRYPPSTRLAVTFFGAIVLIVLVRVLVH